MNYILIFFYSERDSSHTGPSPSSPSTPTTSSAPTTSSVPTSSPSSSSPSSIPGLPSSSTSSADDDNRVPVRGLVQANEFLQRNKRQKH
jgi:hypothetical protein